MLSTKKNVKPAKRERHRKVAEAFLSEFLFFLIGRVNNIHLVMQWSLVKGG